MQSVKSEAVGPWNEGLSKKEKSSRHSQGWSNQFGFPWELGMFWNLTVGGVGQRAIGCPGLDEPFGSLKTGPTWPFRNNKSPIWASPAMQCGLNNYAPDGGPPMHQIIDELASDNEYFADTVKLRFWNTFRQQEKYSKTEVIPKQRVY